LIFRDITKEGLRPEQFCDSFTLLFGSMVGSGCREEGYQILRFEDLDGCAIKKIVSLEGSDKNIRS
jgi:hypothetical protein